MARVVCFGELLLRLTAPGRELLLQSGRLDVHVGGAEANVAVALSLLGHETAMVSRVPDSALGDAALAHLRRHGVEASGVDRGAGRMGLYFLSPGAGLRPPAVTYDREGSSFALSGPDEFDWDRLLEGADWLHLSGVTAALGPRSADAAIAAAEAARIRGVPVSFDGNYRAQLWQRWDGDPRAILKELIGRAEILFGNHRDVALVLGEDFAGEGEPRRRDAALAAFGAFPDLKAIASTARHVDDADRHRIAARIDTRDRACQIDEIAIAGIVDRIGTGDAFAAGVLHGLLGGCDHERAARIGLALCGLKHSVPGDASLSTPVDIDRFLAGEVDVRR